MNDNSGETSRTAVCVTSELVHIFIDNSKIRFLKCFVQLVQPNAYIILIIITLHSVKKCLTNTVVFLVLTFPIETSLRHFEGLVPELIAKSL